VDVTLYLFINDSTSTTGAGKTGLAYNTASLTASYVRPLGSRVAITLATQTVTGAHSDGGFVEIDATNMPGVYRFDLPDAVCATGVGSAVVFLHGATGMAPVVAELELVVVDPNNSLHFGVLASGTLSGTHSATTADLGTNAPSYALEGSTLLIQGFTPRIITSYNTGTGVATVDTWGSSPTNGTAWVVVGTPPAANSGTLPAVNVTQISGDSVAADNLESYCDGTTPMPVNTTQISGDSVAADNLESYTDGTTPMPVNVTQISGDATAADNLETYTDGTDRMPVDVREINSAVVNGNGTSGTPWTGA
jgi:hypothetical protein